MRTYYVNSNPQGNGDYEVHTENCEYIPNQENRKFVGNYSTCIEAISKAKKTYPKACGCFFCSYDWDTG